MHTTRIKRRHACRRLRICLYACAWQTDGTAHMHTRAHGHLPGVVAANGRMGGAGRAGQNHAKTGLAPRGLHKHRTTV